MTISNGDLCDLYQLSASRGPLSFWTLYDKQSVDQYVVHYRSKAWVNSISLRSSYTESHVENTV